MIIRADETNSPPEPATARVLSATAAQPARIVIQLPLPAVDGGAYPIKRCLGDTVEVSVDVFRDGHELLRAVVRSTAPDGRAREILPWSRPRPPLAPLEPARWLAVRSAGWAMEMMDRL